MGTGTALVVALPDQTRGELISRSRPGPGYWRHRYLRDLVDR